MFVSRRLVGAVLGAAVALSGIQVLTTAPASANPAGTALVISEVYAGGSGTAASPDFVVLYNPTAATIDLTAGNYYLASNSATSAGGGANLAPTKLTGSIPAHGHFMLASGTAGTPTTVTLSGVTRTSDQSATFNAAASAVTLWSATPPSTIPDGNLVGTANLLDAATFYSPATGAHQRYEGTAAPSTFTNTNGGTIALQRKADATVTYQDTDDTATDLYLEPNAVPKNTTDVVGGGGTPEPTPLALATPGAKTGTVGSPFSLQLNASGGTGTKTYSLGGDATAAGLTVSASGLISGTPTATGTFHVTANVQDDAGAPGVSVAFDLTVSEPAPPGESPVVISELWGDGGYTGAPYKNNFVELYNPSDAAVSLAGMSIGYLGASNATPLVVGSTQQANLTGSIPAHGYYLIGGPPSGTATNGVALPTPDVTTTLKWNYADGTIALLDTQAAVSLPGGNLVGAAHVIDAVGYGPSSSGYHAVAYETAETGFVTDVAVAAQRTPTDADTDDNSVDFTAGFPTPTNAAGVTGSADAGPVPTSCASTFPASSAETPVAISTIQGNTDISAGVACTVTTTGVVTAVYTKGFNSSGAATCAACGFYIQDPNGDPADDKSDALFVFGGPGFKGLDSTGATIAIGDVVTASGKVSEYKASGAKLAEYLTELNASTSSAGLTTTVTKTGTGTITPQTELPTTYAQREAHEGELYKPTDVVVTDTYNFESQGELGLAAGAPTGPAATALSADGVVPASAPLQQPGQICRDRDTDCLTAAAADIKNRGYFLTGGTTYLGSFNIYSPEKAANSDIPYPFIDEDHSARVGAQVTYPTGGVLDFRGDKWFLNPPRSVVASCANAAAPHGDCVADRGDDVVQFEDTRATNEAPRPAPAGTNLRFATYNVENYFSVTMNQFAAANPLYKCEYDNDRNGVGILSFQCTNPKGQADQWDPVTGAATHYKSALANAPRGAGRQEDLDRQTTKIVTAINRLGADVVALEEIGNPNKLKLGVTNDPLNPDLTNTKDQGQGTAIEWRDETLAYLVDHLNAALPADEQWAFAASPEETTDATSVPGLCATVQPNGTPVPGLAKDAGTCSYSSGQDVIRSAFIYKKKKVIPVGSGDLDLPGYTVNGTPDPWGNHVFKDSNGNPTSSPFDNAREPFAQYFKPVGAKNNEGFALIVNHFKSKGDADEPAGPAVGDDANDPLHGAFNASRVAQAKELVRFANAFAEKWDTDKVFMLGDYNAYSGEDPVHAVLDDPDDALDFQEIHSDDPKDTSYVFSTTVDGIGYGGAGSLDHIFASAGARATHPKTDIWEINANEPDVYDYGRYNTNATDFFDGSTPWRGSDHNPEVVDLTLPSASADKKVTDVQIVGINDFHGRLIQDASDGGAAPLAGAINSLRGIYGADETVVASAGDNVGASIFESFTQEDKPTLDALNAMDLQVSSVGNHEFDRGVNDLLNRIEKPKSDTNPYGADAPLTWGDYLAANVVWSDGPKQGQPISDPTKVISVPNPLSGTPIKIGFVGTVTSDLPSLQSPANLEGVTVLNSADTNAKVNEYAAELKAEGANLVVLLTHEGAASTDCSSMLDKGNAFSTVLKGVDSNVDAIVSGHTHLEYSCQFPKDATASNPLTVRPVLQGGSYGTALDQLVYSFDAQNKPVDLIANNVGVKGPVGALFNYGKDPVVQPIVTKAIADSAVAGAKVLGKMTAPMYRSKLADSTDNRGGESVLGNQVAEIQRWATADDQHGGAQIAFMNPGGLRADALGTKNGDVYDLTYREAADVQPFANELINMKLTGAQIKKVLEEQWQRDASGNIPARPFLKLGISKGFTYTYTEKQDPAKPTGALLGTVTGMWLDGAPIDADTTYSVTVNSFLSTGGDNFWELDNGADKLDTETSDLDGQVAYMKQYEATPLEVDSSQRGVRVTFPPTAPATYAGGDTVAFDLASLDMNGGTAEQPAVQDSSVSVKVGGVALPGTFPVTHGNSTANPDDRYGTASVSVTLPADAKGALTVIGNVTGTEVIVPLPGLEQLPITAGTPTVTGTAKVGETLIADAGAWTPAAPAFSYIWKADGEVIPNATASTYVVQGDDLGKAITVAVTGAKAGYTSATSVDSAATTPVALGTLTATTPVIDGVAKVGETLSASTTGWRPLPVAFSYVWKSDGSVIEGATSSAYVVQQSDLLHQITVEVTGTKSGYASETKISDATLPVTAATPALALGALGAGSWTVGAAITPVTAHATGGVEPYAYAATGLPAGVSIAGAVISGTPTTAGSGTATVTVTDGASHTASTSLAWTVTAPSSNNGGGAPAGPAVGTPGNPAPIGGATLPSKIKKKVKRVTVSFSAVGASAAVVNGKVVVFDGKKKVGTFTVRGGKVVIKFKKKLTKGKHKLRFVLRASSTSKAATIRKTLKVK